MPSVPVGDVLQRLGWVATRQQLLAAGVSRKRLCDALAAGEVVRLQTGVYGPASGAADVAAAVRLNGALSHGSAAQWWRMEMLHPPAGTYVTVSLALKKVAPPGVVPHRADVPTTVRRLVRVTTPLQTVVDCLRTLPAGEGVVIGDSAIRHGLVTRREVLAASQRLRGRGAPAAKHAAAMLGPGESVLESACRVILLEAGLPRPREQLEIATREGVKRVDFAWPEHRVVLEAEGFASHGFRFGLVQDCVRTNGLQLAGWLVLRAAWEHVMGQPGYVVDVVRDALSHDGGPHLPRLRRFAA